MGEGKALHTVGSLVEADGVIRMVCGYRLIDDNGTIGVGYILVPYPFGFIDESSISMLPASRIGQVFSEGSRDEEALAFVQPLEEIANAAESSSTLEGYYKYINDALSRERSEV